MMNLKAIFYWVIVLIFQNQILESPVVMETILRFKDLGVFILLSQ